MDFSVIFENFDLYIDGVITTVQLVFLAMLIGTTLAVPLAIMRTSKNPAINGPVWVFTYIFRGTPLLVQMFVIYFGLGQFEAVRDSIFWPILREAYWCALLAFTCNTAAYSAEIFRGAIEATPRGEVEAAKASGMSRFQMYRRIILPSTFRRALPVYSNEVIFMLHGSAIASVITIIDITGAARIINSRALAPYESFITAGLLYMAITFVIVFVFRRVERRWHAHLRPRET